MSKEIIPGLTAEGASLITQLALKGLQAIYAEAHQAGAVLEAAAKAAQPAPAEVVQDEGTTQ